MINLHVQICNPMEIDALMNSVGQGNEIIEHITFKKRLPIIEHMVHILFIDLHCCYEFINKNIP
jgi:hypothetical protein